LQCHGREASRTPEVAKNGAKIFNGVSKVKNSIWRGPGQTPLSMLRRNDPAGKFEKKIPWGTAPKSLSSEKDKGSIRRIFRLKPDSLSYVLSEKGVGVGREERLFGERSIARSKQEPKADESSRTLRKFNSERNVPGSLSNRLGRELTSASRNVREHGRNGGGKRERGAQEEASIMWGNSGRLRRPEQNEENQGK